MTEALRRQPDETWGFVLLVAGVLLVLGIYVDVLGLAGHWLRSGTSRAFGWGADTIPACVLAAGGVLVAGRARRGAVPLVACLSLLVLAASGLADLAGGAPQTSSSWKVLSGAGGAAGALYATPARSLLGTTGAAIVLGALAFAVLCPLLGLSVGGVLRGTRHGAAIALGGLRRLSAERRQARASGGSSLARAETTTRALTTTGSGSALGQWDDDLDGAGVSTSSSRGGTGPGESLDVAEPAPPRAPAAAVPIDRPPAGFQDVDAKKADPGTSKVEQLSLGIVPVTGPWRLPPTRLLDRTKPKELDEREVEARGHMLERALAAHGVETRLVGYTIGPTVTRFELQLGPGVKVARVTSLSKDIAYAMASADVRILAPIPGRSAIGVEVPNTERQLVTVGDVLASPESIRMTHPLEVPMGRDIAGRAVIVNLAEMPHILIAGATGAGKSSCINSLLTSVLMRATPDQVRLILVDPKRVELGQYNGLPHLLAQVVVNPKRAANALSWAVAEMERRYDLLAEVGMRDITGYNAAFDRGDFAPDPRLAPRQALPAGAGAEAAEAAEAAAAGGAAADGAEASNGAGASDGVIPDDRLVSHDGVAAGDDADMPGEVDVLDEAPPPSGAGSHDEEDGELASPATRERLPYILIVVDELNDLMMVAARDVEESICRLAQMARAVGIHLVIATQRPSVDVITGVIKANIPSRLAFSVSSLADSRVILDQPGAERLVGRGDLLLLTASSSVARRLQGPWVTEKEVHAIVGHWRRQSGPRYVEGVEGEEGSALAGGAAGEDDDDDLLQRAMELVVRSQLGSTSMLQRKLRVGFARAGRLMDLLERRGVVGPSEGSKARAVLMTAEELDQLGRE